MNEAFEQNFSLSDTSLKKKLNNNSITKKLIILILLIIIIITLIIVITIILLNENKEKENSILGEITCIYDIERKGSNQILSNDFQKLNNFDIYINDEKIKYSKIYDFQGVGKNIIKYILYEDLNMNNMFKDIQTLISINLTSFNNASITSLINSFENCSNLKSFNINGFNTNKIKSLKKIFYNADLSEYFNIKDFTYRKCRRYVFYVFWN